MHLVIYKFMQSFFYTISKDASFCVRVKIPLHISVYVLVYVYLYLVCKFRDCAVASHVFPGYT
jgi:hypothetical protein